METQEAWKQEVKRIVGEIVDPRTTTTMIIASGIASLENLKEIVPAADHSRLENIIKEVKEFFLIPKVIGKLVNGEYPLTVIDILKVILSKEEYEEFSKNILQPVVSLSERCLNHASGDEMVSRLSLNVQQKIKDRILGDRSLSLKILTHLNPYIDR